MMMMKSQKLVYQISYTRKGYTDKIFINNDSTSLIFNKTLHKLISAYDKCSKCKDFILFYASLVFINAFLKPSGI